jgi:YfiR/HmsC-like
MKRISLLIIAIVVLKFSNVFAQSEKFQALFIYNFTKYIEWPTNGNQEFVIGVLGNDIITNELRNVAANKKVGNQNITVKTFSSKDELSSCNIIYIPSNKNNNLDEVLAKANNNTLIVTDKKGAAKQGSAINFVIVDGKQKFEINSNNISKRGLKVDPNLLNLGINVI